MHNRIDTCLLFPNKKNLFTKHVYKQIGAAMQRYEALMCITSLHCSA